MADLVQDSVSLFLLAIFVFWLAAIPILSSQQKFSGKDLVRDYLYNLRVWQTCAAGFFVVGAIGMAAEGFDSVAREEWDVAPGSKELKIAAAYEGFWCFAMIPWFCTGLANAWLPLADLLGSFSKSTERQIRARFSVVWAVAMLCFWPVAWRMTFTYDVERPPTVIVFLGLLFVQTLIAALLEIFGGESSSERPEGAAVPLSFAE